MILKKKSVIIYENSTIVLKKYFCSNKNFTLMIRNISNSVEFKSNYSSSKKIVLNKLKYLHVKKLFVDKNSIKALWNGPLKLKN